MTKDTHDHYTRRDVLKRGAAAGAVALGSGAFLASPRAGYASADEESSQHPKRGGNLRIGVTGGSTSDSIDAGMYISQVSGLMIYQLYDSLYAFDKNARPQLSLAKEVEHNKDASVWTVRLRDGVTFHNGKDVTAEDVAYTFRRILNPKKPLIGAVFIKKMDLKGIKILDKHTLRIPFHVPFAQFPEVQATYFYFIVPSVGYNPKAPIGSGPFEFRSFTPGQQATFVRNPHYWQSQFPYVDQVVITDFADETSQLNALSSGQIDLAASLSGSSIPLVKAAGGTAQIADGMFYAPLAMRMDVAPFNDIRVRQALRLVVDRKQMRDLVFSGHGIIGNDIFGYYEPTYDHALPQREVDVAEARKLLRRAGHTKLNITFIAADVAAGALRGAQIFAQQAAAAGVTVNIKQVPVSTLFGPNYLHWHFFQDLWAYNPYVLNVENDLLPGGIFNGCHANYPPYTKLWGKLTRTVNPSEQKDIAHEMQRMEWDGHASGNIIPYFIPTIDGIGKGVFGLTPSKTGNYLGGFDLKTVWLG